MFGFRKKKKEENYGFQSFERDFKDIAKIMNVDINNMTPIQQLGLLTLAFGKLQQKDQGMNIGNTNSESINYLCLNDFSFADTLLVTSIYNVLLVAGRMDVNKVGRFQASYIMWVERGIKHLTNIDTVELGIMVEDRLDAYLGALKKTRTSGIEAIKSVFERLIINDISGDYQDYNAYAPLNLLGIGETVNVKTQIGGLFEAIPATFDRTCQMVANSF